MDVDLVWVNRVGIILNFVAGFLMAPDLIGREYLARIEHVLKRTLIRVRRVLRKPISSYERRHYIRRNATPRYRRFVVESGCWSMCFFFLFWGLWLDYLFQMTPSNRVILAAVVGTLIGATILYKLLMALALSDGRWQQTQVGEAITLIFFMLAQFPLAIVLGFLIGPAAILLYGLPRLLAWATGLVMHRLRGNERFLKVLLVTGILFFVLGNFLQLWATKR